MIASTLAHTTSLTSIPRTVVRTILRKYGEIATINLAPQEEPVTFSDSLPSAALSPLFSTFSSPSATVPDESPSGLPSDAPTYTCLTLHISSSSTLTADQVFPLLYSHSLYTHLTTASLKDLTTSFHIPDYDTLAALLISGRYTTAQELAAHRKALSGDTTDLMELNLFVEECKNLARPVFAK